MTDNTQELNEILTKLENAVALNIGSQGMRGEAPKHSHWKAKQALFDCHTRKLNEAIREEWALISEVAHSANITAELFISKAREDRLAELDTINAGQTDENILLTQEAEL